jgi:ribonucleoside-triphosphate reductase
MEEVSDISKKVLSDVIVYTKYAKYIPEKKRRETWIEIIDRNKEMYLKKFPELKNEIEENFKFIYNKKVLPSMRSLQFAGKPIELNPVRLYNCSALAIDSIEVFSETMFLLLSGTGVGYSVQKHDIKKLPPLKGDIKVKGKEKKRRYLIDDSINGWASAIKELINSYFKGEKEIDFDYRDIRAKGAHLVTSGGKAPGPQPLKDCIHNIRKVLDRAVEDRGSNCKLKSIEAHDLQCYIADAVLAGGIRRAAMISLFSFDDEEMMTAKYGNWWELNPQRGRANNSVVLVRHKIQKEEFTELWKKIELSRSGEPGIFFTNDKQYLTNPCAEISLHSNQFCNLTTINVGTVINQEDFNERCKIASFLGTLQATFTDFHFLRELWSEQTEKEALLGVSMTGIASGNFLDTIDLKEGALIVKKENERLSKVLGINKAARCTTTKPEGTSSLVCGTSSGIHAWHNNYYIRRIRVGKNEAIYNYFKIMAPEFLEEDIMNPNQAILKFPIKSPEGSILRNESPISLLERMKKVHEEWIVPGHRKGSNNHNVSVTVSIKDDEWIQVGEWMWNNRNSYNGISVLPFDGGSYTQAPFTDCSKEEYEVLYDKLHDIHLEDTYEDQDATDLKGEVACGGNACEVK